MMNEAQAKVIVLRALCGWLHAIEMPRLVVDWDFHTPENRARLADARAQVLADLATVTALNDRLRP